MDILISLLDLAALAFAYFVVLSVLAVPVGVAIIAFVWLSGLATLSELLGLRD